MKNIKNIVLSIVVVAMIIVVSGFTISTSVFQKNEDVKLVENKHVQTVNLFVTHGHCSTTFAGNVDDLKVNVPVRGDFGYFLQDTKISFEIDPNSFSERLGNDLTESLKTPGLFIGENEEKMAFRSTEIYAMGIDWYQVNGTLSIKGIEKEVKLFVTGIRDPKDAMVHSLVLQGQINMFDWGIDYDKMVDYSRVNPTKWMHINMKIELS